MLCVLQDVACVPLDLLTAAQSHPWLAVYSRQDEIATRVWVIFTHLLSIACYGGRLLLLRWQQWEHRLLREGGSG